MTSGNTHINREPALRRVILIRLLLHRRVEDLRADYSGEFETQCHRVIVWNRGNYNIELVHAHQSWRQSIVSQLRRSLAKQNLERRCQLTVPCSQLTRWYVRRHRPES